MLTAGNKDLIKETYRKLISVRLSKRLQEVGDLAADKVQEAISQAGLTPEAKKSIA